MGSLAWNASLLPAEEREHEIRRLARELFPPPRARLIRLFFWAVVSRLRKAPTGTERVGDLLHDVAFEKVVREMIDRKERLFPQA